MNNECLEEWEAVSKQLEVISTYHLPRHDGICEKSDLIEYRLVCFCDASGMAYATTVYLHQSFGDVYKADWFSPRLI